MQELTGWEPNGIQIFRSPELACHNAGMSGRIRHEMDELYDANMQQLALTASGMMADRGMPVDASAFSKKWPKGEQIFLIQIWNGKALDYSSHPVADFPLQGKAGFGRVFFQR